VHRCSGNESAYPDVVTTGMSIKGDTVVEPGLPQERARCREEGHDGPLVQPLMQKRSGHSWPSKLSIAREGEKGGCCSVLQVVSASCGSCR
jgi:hypothetical protein